ncbi:MAG: DUF5916 domain-containing protein [Bacteroidales bacterium]|nr:DUF5916 domain-containing protein [Bacteroidales bacterium]
MRTHNINREVVKFYDSIPYRNRAGKFHIRTFFLLLPAILIILSMNPAVAQNQVVLSKFEGELKFDGICDEAAWDKVAPVKLISFTPDYGAEPLEKTIVKIAYDRNHIYAGAILYDSNIDKVKIQLKRDDWKYECDWLAIILDTFNDSENTLAFCTSPSGGRTDVAFSNDFEVLTRDMNPNWNTFWDVKTSVDDTKWQVEIRIPFSSLRYHEEGGKIIMGLGIVRYLPYKNEVHSLPTAAKEHGFWGTWKASQTQEIVISGVTTKKPVYITPYALAGIKRENSLNEAGTQYEHVTKPEWDIGMDTKLRVSDNLTLDLSLNTDFAQVENDNQRVNLTRFPLFFEEKRQFFQERNTNFEFNFDQYNRLFHTREIGLYKGQPLTVYGGARLVGRLKSWDIGFLSMQTAPYEDELLSENFTVLRLQKDVINDRSTIGGIITNRMNFSGGHNTAYGIDGLFNLFGNEYLRTMWAQTFDNDQDNSALSTAPARIFVQWERRQKEGLAYIFNYNYAGSDYNPGMGFESRRNYSSYGLSVSYHWINDKSRLYYHGFSLKSYLYSDNLNKITETSAMNLGWDFESRGGMTGGLGAVLSYENLPEDFNPYPELSIPSGEYSFLFFEGNVHSPRGRSFVIGTSLSAGKWYDGWSNSITLNQSVIIKQRLQLDATYLYSMAGIPARDQEFNSHIVRLRGQLLFSTKLSVSAFIQYSSISKLIPANIRLRYNPREGNDLYIIYDEGFNTDLDRMVPALPASNLRSIMLKYTYTFIL